MVFLNCVSLIFKLRDFQIIEFSTYYCNKIFNHRIKFYKKTFWVLMV
jgi:hypothetical protein